MHIHLATAGESTEPIIKGLKLISGIEKVYLLYSKQYLESEGIIAEFVMKGNTLYEAIPVQEYDFQDVMDNISRIVNKDRKSGPHYYSINVTGGTKPMAFAAYSSAYFIGATVYYVKDRPGPLKEQLLPILTTRAPKNSKSNKKGRSILKFIYEKTMNNKSICSKDIEDRFHINKQQVSYYIKNLRADGLITTENGCYNPDTKGIDYRHNSIRLTQQGQMEAMFTRNERSSLASREASSFSS